MRIPRRLIALLAATAACAAPVSLSMAQAGDPVQGRAAVHLVEAEKYTAAGDYRAAIIELKNAVLEAPWSPRLHKELGAAYLAVGDSASAEKELRRAIDRDPEWLDPRLLLAEAWLAQGKPDSVLNELWAAEAPRGEDRARVHVLHGRAHLQSDDLEKAREAFTQALQEQADYAPAYLGMASAALQEGEPSMARLHIENAEQAQGADPADVLDLKAKLAVERGDYEAAEEAYRSAAELEPQQLQRLTPLGAVQIELGKFDEADATLARLLKQRPGDGTATYYRAYGAYRRGDPETALTLANSLLSAGAENPAVLFVAGASAFFAERNELAIKHLEHYQVRVPADPAAVELLGRAYLRVDKPAKALALLGPPADRPDAGAGLLTAAGIAAMRTNDLTTGSSYLERAADLRSGNERVRLLAGAAKMSAGDREEAFAELEALAASPSSSRALDLGLLEERVQRAEFAQAIPLAERYQERYPERPEGWALGGIALVRTGQTEAAQRAFERALDLSPGYPDAGIGLAEVAMRRGDEAAARKALQSVLEHHPGHEKVLLNLAQLEMRAGAMGPAIRRLEGALEHSPGSGPLRLALVRACLESGRPLKAIATADAGPADDPELLALRGEAQLRAGRNDDAVASFLRLVETRPDAAASHSALASAYEATGDLKSALREYELALEQDPAFADARIGEARVRLLALPLPLRAEAFNAEVDRMAGLVKDYPNDAGVVRLSALVDVLARRAEKAVTKLEALYRATGDGEVAMELASAQARAGESEGALATLGAHLDTYPEDVAVRVRLAELLVAADEFAAAAEHLTRVRALDPQRPGIRAALGWSLMRAGRVAEAAPLARAGYEERPDDPAVLHTLGVVLLEEGHAERAEALLKKAMDAGWPGPRLRLDYARALERNGRHGQARSVLEELLALQQGFPERTEAHALLNSLPE